MEERSFIGGYGWIGLAAYVTAWDVWAMTKNKETLSGAYYRSLGSWKTAVPVLVWTALTVKHLALPKVLPQIDLLHHAAEFGTKKFGAYPTMKAYPNDSSLLP